MIELEPCPFCGKPMRVFYTSRDNGFKFSHKSVYDSSNCKLVEPIIFSGSSIADAVRAYNNRPDTSVQGGR